MEPSATSESAAAIRESTDLQSAAQGPDRATLKRFSPLNVLNHAALHDLQAHMRVFELEPGNVVFAAGLSDDWAFFLLSGELTLHEDIGTITTIRAPTPESLTVLAAHQPRRATARVVQHAQILRMPASLLEMLLVSSSSDNGYTVAELQEQAPNVSDRLMFQIMSAYRDDRIAIPSLPEVVVRIRSAVSDPDVTFAQVGDMVAADTAVAARLVQVANSAAYASVNGVGSVREAVARMGLERTRELVTALALSNVFKSDDPTMRSRLRKLWEHSTWVAAISYHLAKLSGSVNPDLALLGGLVHDIGATALIVHASSYKELRSDPATLPKVISGLRGPVGGLILRGWNFPDALVTTALEAEDWMRDDNTTADCCDVVVVAQLLSFVGTAQFQQLPRVNAVPAFGRVNLGTGGAQAALDLLKDAEHDLRSLQAALMNTKPG